MITFIYNLFVILAGIYMRDMYDYATDWELSDYERGQLEMLIDGEGHIGMKKIKRKRLRRGHTWGTMINITNSCYDLLERAKEICGGGAIIPVRSKTREKAGDKWKDSYLYQMPVTVQRKILPQLQLIVKEQQRLLVLDVLEMLRQGHDHTETEEKLLVAIYEDLHKLNKKGK